MHQLGDAVAPVAPRSRPIGIVVDQDDLQLAAVARVDQPRRVEAGHAVAQRQAAAGQHEAGVPARDGHGHPGRHQRPGPPRGAATTSVRATRSAAGVARRGRSAGTGRLGVELVQRDAQHRRTLQGPHLGRRLGRPDR